MKWVLIIYLIGQGVSVTSVEMSEELPCEIAATRAEIAGLGTVDVEAFCIYKGVE